MLKSCFSHLPPLHLPPPFSQFSFFDLIILLFDICIFLTMHPPFQTGRTVMFLGDRIFTSFSKARDQRTSHSLQMNEITLYYTFQSAYNMKLKFCWRSQTVKALFLWQNAVSPPKISTELASSVPPPSCMCSFVLQKQAGFWHQLLNLLWCKEYIAERWLDNLGKG